MRSSFVAKPPKIDANAHIMNVCHRVALQKITTMKKTNILYWSSTGLFCAFMLTSAIPNLLASEEWIAIMESLGYPAYLLPFLGVAKLLGVVALVVPGFARLKEWAYAGFFFDLLGATYSAIAVEGLQLPHAFMVIPFTLLALSYVYWHKRNAQRIETATAPKVTAAL